jgi:hypothetical protein
MFFSSWVIPFSGDILLPVVWIYDKRVFFAYLAIDAVDLLRVLPGAIYITEGLPWPKDTPINLFDVYLIPTILAVLGIIAISASCMTSIGAWWLKRKIRKKAPDLLRALG